MSWPGTTGAAMSRDEADAALDALTTEYDRIAAALLDLDSHPGRQLLDGTRLAGATKATWDTAQARLALLWAYFDAYRAVLDRARALRARKAKPGAEELAELTELCRGRSAVFTAGQIPLERRSVSGPAQQTDRLTLAELVGRMNREFSAVTEVVVEVDAAWSRCLELLDPAERDLAAASQLAAPLGLPAEDPLASRLAGLGSELATLRAGLMSDPLSGTAGRLAALGSELAAIRARLAELSAARERHAERIARLDGVLAQLATAETEAAQARVRVLAKIDAAAVPDAPTAGPALAARLAGLREHVDAGRWSRLADGLTALERDAAAALAAAHAGTGLLDGLLERRAELRSRLDAYRVKAARLGRGEDPDLAGRYQQARELLWASPCDLRAATRAVVSYQRAILGGQNPPAEGPPGRTGSEEYNR